MKLYHATYGNLMDSIMEFGLGGGSSGHEWPDSVRGVVYFSVDPHVAVSYAETNDDVPEDWLEDIVVLEVDSGDLDESRLRVDGNVIDNDGTTLEYHGVVPYSDLRVVEDIDESAIIGNWARLV